MATWLVGYKLWNDSLPRPLKVTGSDEEDAAKAAVENLAALGWDPGTFVITAVMRWQKSRKATLVQVG